MIARRAGSMSSSHYHLHTEDTTGGRPAPPWHGGLLGALTACATVLLVLGFTAGNPEQAHRSTSQQLSAVPTCKNGFPVDFIWGLGTAAYQIEGGVDLFGRTPSIWDTFSHVQGKTYNGDTGDTACDHIHRYKSDVQLMKSIRLRHYRFSISWSRVMTWDAAARAMVPNEPGLRWYDSLLDELEGAGITPYVTLYHWDLPQALHDELGGWHTPDNTQMHDEFVRYARLCFERFGARVHFWVTFNEPWTFAVSGYSQGNHAPGCAPAADGPCPNGDTAPYIVAHNVLLAHAAAAHAFHAEFEPKHGGAVSITLPCEISTPLTSAAEDVAAAERANEFFLGWWLQPLVSGDYPAVMREYVGGRLPRFTPAQAAMLRGSIDVLTLNHYSTHLVRAVRPGETGDASSGWMADQKLYSSFGDGWPAAASPWQRAYPRGIRMLLNWAAAPGGTRWRGDVIITENGWSCNSFDAHAAAHDTQQVDYFDGYTEQMRLALVEDGVRVKGYFGWSLMDNYEWADGYSKRFGLFYVDYATQQRLPKAAARWWNETRGGC